MKQILVGSILAVSARDLPKFAVLYAFIGAIHWLARRQLLAASEAVHRKTRRSLLWDFVFYSSFSVVVTSSVATAGVLLVFCFLIIPAIAGSLFTRRIAYALGIGCLEALRPAPSVWPRHLNSSCRRALQWPLLSR